MRLKLTGLILLATAGCLVVLLLYVRAVERTPPLIFSAEQLLNATWQGYKKTYIETGSSRTMDLARHDITTSEGESYTLLRAVWLSDKPTFDAAWDFTKTNLRHKNDGLYAWLYGKRTDGTFGVLTDQGGSTAASDADSDIALSLIFAYDRWQDPAYLSAAKQTLDSMWSREVITINGTPYLASNDVEKFTSGTSALLNPSYLSPYSYRIFAEVDPAHPWGQLVDSSYAVIAQSMSLPLDTTSSAGLPPDWILINKQTGVLGPTNRAGLPSQFGYDAMRVPWRLALDWAWFHDPRDKALLSRMTLLADAWRGAQTIDTVYAHDGTVVGAYESPATYGGTIGYFLVTDPAAAKAVYEQKLAFLYNPDTNAWSSTLSYYDDNWAWFGVALYNDLLPNLAAHLSAATYQ